MADPAGSAGQAPVDQRARQQQPALLLLLRWGVQGAVGGVVIAPLTPSAGSPDVQSAIRQLGSHPPRAREKMEDSVLLGVISGASVHS